MSSASVEPYDPFARGPFPVGVRSVTLAGPRALPVEIWYPADPVHAGADLDPVRRDRYQIMPAMPKMSQAATRDATMCPGEPRPLVIFSHGLGGHRRQSTFLCTHLASHGHVVAAPDHLGTTLLDGLALFMQAPATSRTTHMRPWVLGGIEARPDDVVALLDAILGGGVPELAARIDPTRIAMCGHSFGGWTTLQSIGRDPRIRAGVALAPAGGHGAYALDPLADSLRLDWSREVPVQLVVAERDSILPLPAMRELYARLHSPKRLHVLANADHLHFLDEPQRAHEMFRLMPYLPTAHPMPPWSELVGARAAHDAIRALVLAHLDRHLRGEAGARDFLLGDVAGALAARGASLVP